MRPLHGQEEIPDRFYRSIIKLSAIYKSIYIAYNICEVIAMSKSINMCVRVDPELKAQAEDILDQLGMNMNGTINMFLTQIVREKRVPLNLSLNTEQNVMSDIRISRQERENGIEGIDARKLLEDMKKIVSDAEAKDNIANGKAVV